MTDISATKQAENRLHEQDQLFRLIAERLDGYIAVLDTEGRRVYNSPSYQGLLGKRDIAGSDSFMEVHPDDREKVTQAFHETVASGIGQHLEYRFMLPDKSIRIMESRGGVAAGIGAGIEVLRSPYFTLDLQLRITGARYRYDADNRDDTFGITNAAFFVGFNWY